MTESLENLPPLRDVINAHDLRADKKFGQNFLLDQNITDKITRAAGDLEGRHVIEIGPGPGGLTRSLLRGGSARVSAIEFDPRAVKALEGLAQASEGRLEVLHADALELNLNDIREPDRPMVIVANLPYNIATPLLLGWLRALHENTGFCESMTLMFQKEVAERIVAVCGDKAYGRLAVISNWICGCKKVFDLPPSAFTPPPKVKSSIVHFRPRDLGDEAPAFDMVEALSAAAFGQRRKMLRSSLKDYAYAMEALEIEQTLRAENLNVESYLALARYVKDHP